MVFDNIGNSVKKKCETSNEILLVDFKHYVISRHFYCPKVISQNAFYLHLTTSNKMEMTTFHSWKFCSICGKVEHSRLTSFSASV